jgi:hypothetical protein
MLPAAAKPCNRKLRKGVPSDFGKELIREGEALALPL